MEYIGYPKQLLEENGIEMIPDFIREEIRLKVASIFGNAKTDITLFTDSRNGKAYESKLQYEVIVDSITPQMMEHMNDRENYGISFTGSFYQNDEGRKIRFYVQVHRFWAKLICSRDGVTDVSENYVKHSFKPAWDKEMVF
jgi:hypothetical protein